MWVLVLIVGHNSFFWYHQCMDSRSLSCSRNLNKVSPFVFYSFLVCPSWCNWVGITWRAQYGKRRQKILKSNFNIVTKLKLNYLNSLWRKWPNPELQKLQFNREKPQSWMCRMSSQKQGFFFFPYYYCMFFRFPIFTVVKCRDYKASGRWLKQMYMLQGWMFSFNWAIRRKE